MKYISFFFLFSVFFSCQSQTTHKSAAYRDTLYLDVRSNQYEFIGQIPDSLLTLEQRTLINRINDVTTKYISVKNNHMVIDISKAQFVAKGIPERYYHMLQQNIRDNNSFFDANGIKNVDSLMRKRKKNYFPMMLDRQKKP